MTEVPQAVEQLELHDEPEIEEDAREILPSPYDEGELDGDSGEEA